MSLARRSGATVSVAMCTRNGARFVGEQITSVLRQTRLPDEIVVSDDASSDNTLDVVEAAIGMFRSTPGPVPNVVILRNTEALGVARNFEQAIAATSGDLIALSDQDDVWIPERLELACELFEGRPELLMVHGNAELIDEDGASLGATLFGALDVSAASIQLIHDGQAMSLLLKRNVVTGATTLLRRSLFDLARPIPVGWLHDEWLAVVAASTASVDVIQQPLIAYRQHGGNEVGVRTLNLAGKLNQFRHPGSARNVRLLLRARSLAARFDELGDRVPEKYRVAVHDKLAHEEVRSSLNLNRLLRWPRVLRELSTGRYSRFGRGAADAARDLIQPLRSSR